MSLSMRFKISMALQSAGMFIVWRTAVWTEYFHLTSTNDSSAHELCTKAKRRLEDTYEEEEDPDSPSYGAGMH